MKTRNIILSTMVMIALLVLVSAEVTQLNKGFYSTINDDGSATRTTTPVNDFKVIGFVCANDDCSQVNGTLWNGNVLFSGATNEITLSYPSVLLQKGYGLFFYKEGYFPYEVKADWSGNGQAADGNRYLSRKENCQVPINDLVIDHYGNKVVVNVTLSSDVSSPVQTAGPLNYVPDSIKHLYAVDANVSFTFVGPENVTLIDELNLPASESRRASINTILDAGYYELIVESNSNDVKCINSIPLRAYSNLLIEDNRTNATLPTISIISPIAKTYTNGTILVNLRSTNATSVWFNYNGTNITYTNPVSINFADGTYTLNAYAINNVTLAHTQVTFKVNTTIVNNDTDNNETDTTPPASITNLNLVSKTKNSLVWNWINPTDSDFNQAIIYINGVNVINTSSNTYTATGLSSNTEYTIAIHTKDNSGNVNINNISLTSKTLSDSGSNGGGGSSSSNNKKPKVFNDTIEEVKSNIPYIPAEDLSEFSNRKTVNKEKDYSSLLFLLLILTLLLLIIVISLLIIRKMRN